MRRGKKKHINIAHLHWGFPPIIGGVETHLTILLPEFVKMGHKTIRAQHNVEAASYQDNRTNLFP